jgi:hypothetical protein
MLDGVHLNYRTLPVIGDRFTVTHPYNMIAAARLYRGVRRGEIPNFVAISDLYDFYFGDKQYGLSKRTMGAVIVRTVRYNPRKLLGISKNNDKMRVIYSFGHMKEFEYGLEWMICTWLRRFLNETLALSGDRLVSGQLRMEEELEVMVNSDEIEFEENYISPLWNFEMPEPDWKAVAFDLEEPSMFAGREMIERKPLRSYR